MSIQPLPAQNPLEGQKNPKVCIIYAYPSTNSTHGSLLLQKVKETLQKDGIGFFILDMYRENFNPVMGEQEYEKYGQFVGDDVKRYQQILGQCNIWIILYPVWWATPPAILKGFFDRVLTPGFAFSYSEKGVLPLLNGKKALIIRTFGSSASQEAENGSVAQNFMEKSVLGFCGIKSFSVDIYSIDSLAMSAFNNNLMHIEGAVRRSLVTQTGVPHHMRTIPAPYLPPIEVAEKDEPSESNEKKKKKELTKQAQEDLEFFRQERRFARKEVHRKADRQRDVGYNETFGESAGRQRAGAEYSGRQRRQMPGAYSGRSGSEAYSGQRGVSENYSGRQGRNGEVYTGRQPNHQVQRGGQNQPRHGKNNKNQKRKRFFFR